MHDKIIHEVLEDRIFNLGVDLGCGSGTTAIRNHCVTLIGVDHNEYRLKEAKEFKLYDYVVLSDTRDYIVSSDVDAVFITEHIEHMPKQDGVELINRLKSVPYVFITTPESFFKYSLKNGHVSLWSTEDFERLGYRVRLYDRTFPTSLMVKKCIVAIKGE